MIVLFYLILIDIIGETDWMRMAGRRSFQAAYACYKIVNCCSRPYLTNRIKFRADVHNVYIRRKNVHCLFNRSFSYSIVNIYDNKQEHLKLLSYGANVKKGSVTINEQNTFYPTLCNRLSSLFLICFTCLLKLLLI